MHNGKMHRENNSNQEIICNGWPDFGVLEHTGHQRTGLWRFAITTSLEQRAGSLHFQLPDPGALIKESWSGHELPHCWGEIMILEELMDSPKGGKMEGGWDRGGKGSLFHALDSPTVWWKVVSGELMGVEAGVECRDRMRILSSKSAIRRSFVSIYTVNQR